MVYLKKYFMEGLIQMAILLSLCGVRVDVGLPPSWQEMILGPTSALTQTQFHNLRNCLEDGRGLHPKSVDLDRFFTARRLLGLVHSLDRLQVPHAELETWLVQREPDPLPVGFPDQVSGLMRAPAGVERDQITPSVESRAALSTMHEEEEEEEDKEEGMHDVLHDNSAVNEKGEEEKQEEDNDLARLYRHCRRAEEGGSNGHSNNRELNRNEVDQLHDIGDRMADLEHQSSDREPMMPAIIPSGNPSLDLELHWQDLLAIMEPEDTDVDRMTSSDHTQKLRTAGTHCCVGSEAAQQNCTNHGDGVTQADREVLQSLLVPPNQSVLETALFPLTPTTELDEHSSAFNTRDALKNPNMTLLQNPPDHTDLLSEDPSQDFSLGLKVEDNLSTFNMNLLTQELVDTMEGGPCSQYASYPENPLSFDSHDLTPFSFTPFLEGNCMTQDLSPPPSSNFLFDDGVGDEHGLPSPLNDLLEDAANEIRVLDHTLEKGHSPDMAARLDEEGYLSHEITQQETGRDDHCSSSNMVEASERQQQDSKNEADSDSGLSLDFSHSLASPCASEASSYSYSSSSFSSSCVSAEECLLSEEEFAEEGSIDSDMEMEVTMKQDELKEEELGAVGGVYLEDVKKPFSPHYGDEKIFNGFPWLEHDHTYNQPRPSASSPLLGKMPTKQTKFSLRYDSAKPYHHSASRNISEAEVWSRDERRARALKVPFSTDLIVNLPVEEFNDLLANFQLSEEQLTLVRDIRRRGKNKIAAQNCRKRKMDILLGLNDDVSGLIRYRSRLLREKKEALRSLQEIKHQLGVLYQEVFSRLREEEGRQRDATEYLLHCEPNGRVTVASHQQGTALPLTKNIKKTDGQEEVRSTSCEKM